GGVLAPDDERGLELGRGSDDHHARPGDQGVAPFPKRHALIIVRERLEQTGRRGVGKRKETIDHREIGRRILANARTLEPGCRGCQATPPLHHESARLSVSRPESGGYRDRNAGLRRLRNPASEIGGAEGSRTPDPKTARSIKRVESAVI